jgi:hypothetical protein
MCVYVCMSAVELGRVGTCHQRLWIRDRETSLAGVYVHTQYALDDVEHLQVCECVYVLVKGCRAGRLWNLLSCPMISILAPS